MSTKNIQKWLIILCALVPLFFGIAWIYTFGLTEYRSHLAHIGFPLGVFMLLVAIGMFRLNRIAIILSMFLATLSVVAAGWVFLISLHWFYAVVAVMGVFYIVSSKKYLWPAIANT